MQHTRRKSNLQRRESESNTHSLQMRPDARKLRSICLFVSDFISQSKSNVLAAGAGEDCRHCRPSVERRGGRDSDAHVGEPWGVVFVCLFEVCVFDSWGSTSRPNARKHGEWALVLDSD
eukprot:2810883-Rhodomonas_salina.1